MTKITSSLFLAALLAPCLQIASAQAQLVRTCVSLAKGSDANASTSCHCTTPCRSFATAAANTLADGEVTVLDPGDYGGLTITRSISINNDSGGEASITVHGNNTAGIIVNAPNGAGYVNLRGLTIQGVGFGSGQAGLRFNTGFSLTMTNCVIRNIVGNGIEFQPNASSSLAVSNTLVADNGGVGISVLPSGSGTVKVDLDRVEAYTNSIHGILVNGSLSTGTINATSSDSIAGSNNNSGFQASSAAGHAATSFMVVRSISANNGFGLLASGTNATLRVGQSTVTGNTASTSGINGGVLRSYNNNNIDGNGDGDPAPITITTK
jgi:hypothetical protein